MSDFARPAGTFAPSALVPALRRYWFLALAIAFLVIPGLISLAQIVWSTDQGAQGPIILATGLWLMAREYGPVQHLARRGRAPLVAAGIVIGGLGFLIGRMTGTVWFEWLCISVLLLTVFYSYNGGRLMKALWFPILYLMFLVPPPYTLIFPLTRVLKLTISSAAVELLGLFGFSVASSGTTLYIDQYELLVAAACSGMNSLFSLLATGLFYIFLRHRADWRYAVLLAVLVIPIAILTNFLRVVILLLVTHWFGDAVAQGMLHEAAGMIMFFIALFTLMGIDAILSPLRERLFRKVPA